MSTATATQASQPLAVDPKLTSAIIESVENALVMCNTTAKCVSLSTVPSGNVGLITGLIGVHGKVSGFITVNLAERMGIKMAEGLLQESFNEVNSQVVDAAGEFANIIVGGVKSGLAGSQWSFSNITVPSVIVGQGYQLTYARGLEYLCATFEHDDQEAVMLSDRLMNVSVSLLKL